MKKCELCMSPARMYCDSDEANLCWDCDHKIHSANFLVAKHSRSLLCHVCQSSTPWQAAGPLLSPNISVCLSCAGLVDKPEVSGDEEENQSDEEDFRVDDDEEEEEDEGEFRVSDGEEEDGDNQVVPLSSSPSQSSPLARFSGGDDVSSSRISDCYVSLFKRAREESDLDSQDDENGRSRRIKSSPDEEANSMEQSIEQRKNRLALGDSDEAESSRTAAVMESVKQFRQAMLNGGENELRVSSMRKFMRG